MRRTWSLFITSIAAALCLFILPPRPASAQSYVSTVVQPGDSLGKIARRYCTSWQTIYDINRQTIGPEPSAIEVGMVLTVPNSCGTPVSPPGGGWGVYDRGPTTHASGAFRAPYYTVASGDTWYSTAARFGLSVAALQQANGSATALQAGQV